MDYRCGKPECNICIAKQKQQELEALPAYQQWKASIPVFTTMEEHTQWFLNNPAPVMESSEQTP